MSQIVHVVSPDGTRYERIFGDAATPDRILSALRRPDAARLFGRSATVEKKDKVFGQVVPHPDNESPWVVDHPDTAIVIGVVDETGQFTETKRLAGPSVKSATKLGTKGAGNEATPPDQSAAPVPPSA